MAENNRLVFDDLFDIFSMLVGSNYVSLYDIQQRITRFSPAIVDMVGLPGEYIPDGVYNWADYIHPDDRQIYETAMGEMIALRQHTYDLRYRVRLKNGEYNMFRFVGGIMRDGDGHLSIAGGMMINDGLMENTDRVTTMRNLNGFLDDLMKEDLSQNHTILLLGFGRLEHINEMYGYGYGSRLLKTVGECVRETVGNDGAAYRTEGSKFAVFSRSLTPEGMAALYGRIREKLREGLEVEGLRHNLVTHAGMMVNAGKLGENARAIYDCLLHAYTESKRYKDGDLVIYNGIFLDDADTSRKIAMLRAVRESLYSDFNGFYLLYQPVFPREGNRPTGAQAYLMWENEEFGSRAPREFVPEISFDYAFNKLGYWFMRKAFIDGREFLDANPDFMLYVSVTPNFLNDRYAVENVVEMAGQEGFPLSHLSCALVRECRLLGLDKLKQFAAHLRKMGIRVGIDDFARGNAWLKTFGEIRPDFVRFDAELTAHIETSERDRTILSHLAQMVADCGVDIYVKEVNGEGAREFLSRLPVNGMQGKALAGFLYYDEVIERYAAENADHE